MAETDKRDEKPVTRQLVMLQYDMIKNTVQAISSAKIR